LRSAASKEAQDAQSARFAGELPRVDNLPRF
jgi:hypothetical protein